MVYTECEISLLKIDLTYACSTPSLSVFKHIYILSTVTLIIFNKYFWVNDHYIDWNFVI